MAQIETIEEARQSELRALLKLAGPIALMMVGQATLGLVDTLVVGRLGPLELGAVALGNSLFLVVALMGVGIICGLDPMMSQAVGALEPERAWRYLGQGLWVAAGLSAVLLVPLAAGPSLLVAWGVDPALAEMTGHYVVGRLPGLPCMFVAVCAREYLQSIGRPTSLAWTALWANVINLGGDLLFVYGGAGLPAWAGPLRSVPAMGVAGAAFVTSICMLFQATLMAWAALRARPLDAEVGRWRPERAVILQIVRLGLPIGLQSGAELCIFFVLSVFAGRLGTVELATHQLALTVSTCTFSVALGFANGGSVRLGLAIGARAEQRSRRAVAAAYGATSATGAVMGIVIILFSSSLAGWMTTSAATIAAAVPVMTAMAMYQLCEAVQGVGSGLMRGAGRTRTVLLTNLGSAYAVGLPLAAFLAFQAGMGVAGLWWAMTVAFGGGGAFLAWRLVRLVDEGIEPLQAVGAPAGDKA